MTNTTTRCLLFLGDSYALIRPVSVRCGPAFPIHGKAQGHMKDANCNEKIIWNPVKLNSAAFSPQVNHADRSTAAASEANDDFRG
jgi:hypothetical protein